MVMFYNVKQFVPNPPFLYPLKASEKFTVFWCFQELEKSVLKKNGLNS